MPVITRDAVASDHLVYAWPFPIGPEEQEVACSDDEQVVMCPCWVVGDRLGPGRHRWRTPDPTRPISAFFVLTAPVEVSFDMQTSFMVPATGQPVRVRATGSLQVRCADPSLLIAQFVGLPFDHVNEGVMRSVSRSIERMLGRLLARRVVMAGTPQAITEAAMLPNILEELIAYNPAAGAVFGIELMRMGHLTIYADDGSGPWPEVASGWSNGQTDRVVPPPPAASLRETVRAPRHRSTPPLPAPAVPPPAVPPKRDSSPQLAASGEIVVRERATSPVVPDPHRVIPTPAPPPRRASVIDTPPLEETTSPGMDLVTPPTGVPRVISGEVDTDPEQPGAIIGIGTSHIGHVGSAGSATVSGEIPMKIAPGARVLVPGPDGLMQSATVRQLLQGYYELEVGGTGDTIWVPMNGVVPE
jgi:hypothetical protein